MDLFTERLPVILQDCPRVIISESVTISERINAAQTRLENILDQRFDKS